MSDPEVFRQQLEQKRKAVAAARKQAEKAKKNVESLEAELRGWEEAAEWMTGANPTPKSRPAESGNRGLSDKWKGVIAAMALLHPKQFTLDEIGALAAQYGIETKADTLRGHMHHYSTESRYLERVGPGVFRATTDGAAAAGVLLGAGLVADEASQVEDEDEEIPF